MAGSECRQKLTQGALPVIRNEVGAAGLPSVERQVDSVNEVMDVAGGRVGLAAVDPGKAAGASHAQKRRQHSGIARAPHEARANGQGHKIGAIGGKNASLGLGLGLGIEIALLARVGLRLIDVDKVMAGEERGLGADVDEAAYGGGARGSQHALGSLDVGGEELGARFAGATPAPTVFVNVSNIGWFGDSVAIDQHLQISRMRALEFERPMIRATNTGATVIIDHRGDVTHSLPRHTRGVLVGQVQGRTGTTPFAAWVSRLGLWPLWGLGLAVVAAAAWSGRRRRT